MAKLAWDQDGERLYETGTDRGVLFVHSGTASGYNQGVAWNGLTGVTQSPSGAEPTNHYADNRKYAVITSEEEFGGTIEAFTYPLEFEECEGNKSPVPGVSVGQQSRRSFAFVYRTLVGNDLQGTDHAYKLHFVWGAQAAPSEKAHTTVNESVEPMTLSWEFTTTPVSIDEHEGYKPTARITLTSTELTPAALEAVEALIYGTDSEEPEMPTPDELLTLVATP